MEGGAGISMSSGRIALHAPQPGRAGAEGTAARASHTAGARQPFPVSASPPILRRCACGGECPECKRRLRKRPLDDDRSTRDLDDAALAHVEPVLRSPGRALAPDVRSEFEDRLGHSLAHVRIHADARAGASAEAVGAAAYTAGSHIAFAPGRWNPGSQPGRRLLAHELVHTIQQGDATARSLQCMELGAVDDAFEREAETIAERIAGDGAALTRPARTTMLSGSGAESAEDGEREEEDEEAIAADASAADTGRTGVQTAVLRRVAEGAPRLQRRVQIDNPTITRESPAAILKREGLNSNATFGETGIVLNGTALGPGVNIGSTLGSFSLSVTPDTSAGVVRCRLAQAINLTLGHNVKVLTAPPTGGWTASITVADARLAGAAATRACRQRRANSSVSLSVRGQPDDASLATRVEAAENEHVTENTSAFNTHLVPLHDRVAHHASHDTTVPCTRQGKVLDCRRNADCARIIETDLDIPGRVLAFKNAQEAASAVHDDPGGDHHMPSRTTVDPRCTTVTVRADTRRARQRGRGGTRRRGP